MLHFYKSSVFIYRCVYRQNNYKKLEVIMGLKVSKYGNKEINKVRHKNNERVGKGENYA